MATWDDVRAIAARLPGCEESTSYGTPSLKVRNKFMCRLRTDPDALVVRCVDVGDADALKLGQPDVFFSTPHYDGYPMVLVRLPKISERELREVLTDAWRIRAPKAVLKAHPDI